MDNAETITESGTEHRPEFQEHDAIERRLERYDLIEEDSPLDARQLVGDLRDAVLDIFKHGRPWDQMNEHEQRDTVWRIEQCVVGLVNRAVRLIAAEDRASIEATLKQFTGKGGSYKVTLEAMGSPEMASDLARLDGHDVLVISADAEPYSRQTKPRIAPDQMPIEFAESEEVMTGVDEGPAATGDGSGEPLPPVGDGDQTGEAIGNGTRWEIDFANAEMNLVNSTTGKVLESRPATAEEVKAEQERLRALGAVKPRGRKRQSVGVADPLPAE
jgi:hypothetical protein